MLNIINNLYLIYILIISLSIFFIYSIIITIIHIIRSRKWNNIIELLNERVNLIPTLSIKDRVDAMTQLFEVIDILIEYELINNRRYEIFLEKQEKNLDFDNVLEEISKNVFNGIKRDVFTDKNNLVTEQCLMSYIQKRTFIEYFNYLKNKNTSGT